MAEAAKICEINIMDDPSCKESNPSGKQEHESLTAVLKGVHSKLREELVYSDADSLWSSHLQDSETLQKYSTAMHSLAKGPWSREHEGSRITWCLDSINEYFFNDRLLELLQKDLRRLGHGNPTLVDENQLPKSQEEIVKVVGTFTIGDRELDLLDVGSCYNPFKQHKGLNVTAIDIAPATEDVLYCDFLSVNIINAADTSGDIMKQSMAGGAAKRLVSFVQCSFDVVVFSLLLSYLPSTEQRFQCCINAHKLLKLHGVLLIITADSSHQNKHVDMMKSWKNAIESLGFSRWKYTKETHLHCIAFRKTSINCTPSADFHKSIYISQDTTKT